MQRITIPDVMEKMIIEIQKENPLLDKPIDVIKIAMTDFYSNYKLQKSIINLNNTSQNTQVAKDFWKKINQKPKRKTKVLSQKQIDELSYVS